MEWFLGTFSVGRAALSWNHSPRVFHQNGVGGEGEEGNGVDGQMGMKVEWMEMTMTGMEWMEIAMTGINVCGRKNGIL